MTIVYNRSTAWQKDSVSSAAARLIPVKAILVLTFQSYANCMPC